MYFDASVSALKTWCGVQWNAISIKPQSIAGLICSLLAAGAQHQLTDIRDYVMRTRFGNVKVTSVSAVLSRLVREGKVIRPCRGVYYIPKRAPLQQTWADIMSGPISQWTDAIMNDGLLGSKY